MKKNLILLMIVVLLMSCSAAGIPYDDKISDRLKASISEIEAGQTVEPDHFEEYDWVYIIPPYTAGDALDSLEVDEQSKTYIYKQASSYENYFWSPPRMEKPFLTPCWIKILAQRAASF
ncbi:hypothetical protein [Paenibacillus sp. 1P03SA]|uniref:hypothetical protein n=1 Tax=Paenibacillus sp. 1P03SA TaxID=3132294 RepID=UPI0039A02FCD